jgi:putative transposase
MPRTARAVKTRGYYHVLNRGNGRHKLFHKDADFAAFARILAEGLRRYPVELLAWCLMSNHWHLVLRPMQPDALARFMGWVGVTHVRRHHEHYHTRGGGHLYQGRFKSFPIQDDDHFRTVCRYVEANPIRAHLVRRAEQWPWSSLPRRPREILEADWPALSDWPVSRPPNWSEQVNAALPKGTLLALQTSVIRGRPFGEETWVKEAAERLGLGHTLRGPGRPPKEKDGRNQ